MKNYERPEYYIFSNLKRRCNNTNAKNYKNYGGRGIKCLWKNFEEFYADMGDRPGKGYSIDRINNDGHYEKNNCRWVTMKEQCRNRRSNVFIKGQCAIDYCKENNLQYKTVLSRLQKGYTEEQAIDLNYLKPVGKIYKGKNIKQWAEEIGISQVALQNRLKKGDTREEAIDINRKNKQHNLYKGKNMREWADELGVLYKSFTGKVYRLGYQKAIESYIQ